MEKKLKNFDNLRLLDKSVIYLNIYYHLFRSGTFFGQIKKIKIDLNYDKDIFILGTGLSVLDLNSEHFKIIKNGYSLGINGWIHHSFIPDCYAIERGDDKANNDFNAQFMNKSELIRSCNLFLYRSYLYPVKIYSKWFDNIIPYTSVRPITFSKLCLKDRINVYQELLDKLSLPVTLGFSSTLERLVSLAISCRPKNIVLVGVDLNTNTHFYDQNILKENNEGPHLIASNPMRFDSLFDVISSFRDIGLTRGTKISIVNHRCYLSKAIPVFRWGVD